MDFQDAIKVCFQKYATFSGRASRSEYWYFFLFTCLTSVGLGIIEGVLVDPAAENQRTEILSSLFSLAVFLPSLAVAVRRLHDIDRSGWWLLLSLIPLIGIIILLIWMCTKGDNSSNRFGSNPLAALSSQPLLL